MADRVTELSSPPYVVSSEAASKSVSIGNVSRSGRRRLLMQRGFSVTDSAYSPTFASSTHPNLVNHLSSPLSSTPSTMPSTSAGATSTTASKGKKAHHGSVGKWAGLLRAPFERTWSVPDHYSTTNASSPASKTSSRSSIEKIISKEEAMALQRKKQLQPMQHYPKPHPVVIEAPIEFPEPREFVSKPSHYHPLSSYHYFHPQEKQESDPVYLDDPLVDLSPPPTTTSFSSHPILPPSYQRISHEFPKGSFPFMTSPVTSASSVSGNIYSNPSHLKMSQEEPSKSHAGTPVEVKLANIGSPVNFSPFVTTTGSLGGLTGNGGMVFGAKTSAADASTKARSKEPKRRSNCSTQPNSPTSTRQKMFPFFGRLAGWSKKKGGEGGMSRRNGGLGIGWECWVVVDSDVTKNGKS